MASASSPARWHLCCQKVRYKNLKLPPPFLQAARTLAAVRLTFEVKVSTINMEPFGPNLHSVLLLKGTFCISFYRRFINYVLWHLRLFGTVDNEFQRNIQFWIFHLFSGYMNFSFQFRIYFWLAPSLAVFLGYNIGPLRPMRILLVLILFSIFNIIYHKSH